MLTLVQRFLLEPEIRRYRPGAAGGIRKRSIAEITARPIGPTKEPQPIVRRCRGFASPHRQLLLIKLSYTPVRDHSPYWLMQPRLGEEDVEVIGQITELKS